VETWDEIILCQKSFEFISFLKQWPLWSRAWLGSSLLVEWNWT